MAELDLETVDKVVRWCAEAGRQTTPGEVRAALGGLGWDELLALRALLADPPPARPLGPDALADLVRGAPADVAAERERAGRYPRRPPEAAPAAPEAVRTGGPARRTRGQARTSVIVRKKAPEPAPPAPLPRPLLDELLLPAGRAALGQLVRAHGGRRPALLAALAATHVRPDGLPLGDADLDRLLEHHGLTRSFARRERDEVLHAIRAAAGVLARAAASLGYDAAGLAGAVSRLGCSAEVEALRAGKRRDLAGRATLSDRARLLLADPEKLADLGLLEPFEADLKARLPELLEVLGRAGEPLAVALARSVALPVRGVRELATRLGFDLGPVSFAERNADDRPVPRFRADAPAPRARAPRQAPPGGPPARTGPPRPGPATSGPARPGPARPGAPRPDRGTRPSRPGPAPTGSARPPSGSRRDGPRPGRPRPGAPRPGGEGRPARPTSRPGAAPRPGGRSAPPPGRPTGPGGASTRPSRPLRGPRRPTRTP